MRTELTKIPKNNPDQVDEQLIRSELKHLDDPVNLDIEKPVLWSDT